MHHAAHSNDVVKRHTRPIQNVELIIKCQTLCEKIQYYGKNVYDSKIHHDVFLCRDKRKFGSTEAFRFYVKHFVQAFRFHQAFRLSISLQ